MRLHVRIVPTRRNATSAETVSLFSAELRPGAMNSGENRRLFRAVEHRRVVSPDPQSEDDDHIIHVANGNSNRWLSPLPDNLA
jgi:hypothetical protein